MSEIPERVAKLESAVEAHDEEIKRVREIPGELKLLILRLEGLATELSSHVKWHKERGEHKISLVQVLLGIWLAIMTTFQFFGAQARVVLEIPSKSTETEQVAREPAPDK